MRYGFGHAFGWLGDSSMFHRGFGMIHRVFDVFWLVGFHSISCALSALPCSKASICNGFQGFPFPPPFLKNLTWTLTEEVKKETLGSTYVFVCDN